MTHTPRVYSFLLYVYDMLRICKQCQRTEGQMYLKALHHCPPSTGKQNLMIASVQSVRRKQLRNLLEDLFRVRLHWKNQEDQTEVIPGTRYHLI